MNALWRIETRSSKKSVNGSRIYVRGLSGIERKIISNDLAGAFYVLTPSGVVPNRARFGTNSKSGEFMDRTFDPTKPVRTRDGRAARIICTDGKSVQPVVALITDYFCATQESVQTFTLEGRWGLSGLGQNDLVNIPERIHKELWVNVYHNGSSYCIRETRDSADLTDAASAMTRQACVKIIIDCEEGEGL
jgi:hypothetical protein